MGMNVDIRTNLMEKTIRHFSKKNKLVVYYAVLLWAVLVIVPFTRSLAISLFGLIAFYCLIICIVSSTKTASVIRGLSTKEKMLMAVISALFLLFGGWYFSRYHFIPTWDNASYWMSTLQFNKSLFSSPRTAILQALDSVNTSDYNQLLCWILSFPVLVLPTWAGSFYTELILVLIPSSLLMSGFMKIQLERIRNSKGNVIPLWVIYCVFLLIPLAARPIFSGYLDGVGYLLFISLVIALLDDSLLSRKFSIIVIGLGISGAFLIRRWFVFAVIGLVVTVSIYWIFRMWFFDSARRRRVFLRLCIVVVLLALGALLPLLTLFRGFLWRSFSGNYSASYQSWTLYDSYIDKWGHLGYDFGWIWLVLSWISIIIFFVQFLMKKIAVKCFVDFVAIIFANYIGGITSVLVFWRIQDFSPQHWYIVVGFMSLAVYMPIFLELSFISVHLYRRISTIALIIISVVCLCSSFGLLVKNQIVQQVFGGTIQQPYRQSDVKEKGEFVEYLRNQTRGSSLVYFAAASSDLNSSLPYTYYLPSSTTSPFPVAGADVDSRDGFNTDFFNADFVVTSDPVSLHMSRDKEQVVYILNKLVRDHSSYVGRHYIEKRSFSFDNDVRVTVYEKTSSLTREDIIRLKNYFDSIYPDLPELFSDRFDSVLDQL